MEGGCKSDKGARACPFCDAEIAEAAFPYCEACEVQLITCPKCQKPVSRESKVCANCGAKLKK